MLALAGEKNRVSTHVKRTSNKVIPVISLQIVEMIGRFDGDALLCIEGIAVVYDVAWGLTLLLILIR
jgi:hypothetical protein